MNGPLRFAVLGAGFWARYQLAAWHELEGARCVAICDPARDRAAALAADFDIPAVYDDPEAVLRNEQVDFVDVITPPDTHAALVRLAASRKLPVICQKPMAPTLAEAESLVGECREAGVPFFIHENWRWQTPLRELSRVLHGGELGHAFRARLQFACSFQVFDNQPFLKELEQFILTDIGSHVLDTARFLFGEADSLFCRTHRVHEDIAGEDVATVMLRMARPGAPPTTVVCDMSYASRLENERFPQTFAVVECEGGSAELSTDYWLRVTTADGTHARRCPPPRYAWADPAYDVVQASSVPCCADLLNALRSGAPAETHAADNLETVRLVFAAYESARTNQAVTP